jgi:hypothetical protein
VCGLVAWGAIPALAQHALGEIDVQVNNPNGGPVQATVDLSSQSERMHRILHTGGEGRSAFRALAFGPYQLRVSSPGFTPVQRVVEVRSQVPIEISTTLSLAPVASKVKVTASPTLVDPERSGTVYSAGAQTLQEQMPAQMGRGVTDAVIVEPGWLYEANGVPHPRGSEYDVLYVVDGLPITENQSLAFAPPTSSADVQSLHILTAGFPAEYGRKLGGIVEVTTEKEIPAGLHMDASVQGGSFGTVDGNLQIGYAQGKNQFTVAGEGASTDRYLDPPVLATDTNHGSTNGISASYARDLSEGKRIRVSFHRDDLHYLVPNELVQQESGQHQGVGAAEESGQFDYEQTLSRALELNAEGSFREESFYLSSNSLSTPVIVNQQRGFRQGYGRATLSGTHGIHDWEIGADLIDDPVHEALQYTITNASLFDPGTALQFQFADRETDIEPAAFVQDAIHLKNWNVSAGIRYDSYHFVVNQPAWSPRLAVSRYFNRAGLLIHFAYDRIFQTPALENLLLASSPLLSQVSPLFVRLPVPPARANYYEAGLTKGFGDVLRFDMNVYRRNFRNYSDDDTLLDTGVSFPIAFARAQIEGVEGLLSLTNWDRLSGSLSYAYQRGYAQGPITGGLFIGAEAVAGVSDTARFPDSQDQRNTGHARLRFQVSKRVWVATEESYGSGLPVELDTNETYDFLLSQYGPQILQQVDFARGRVRPSYSIDAGAGFDLYNKENKRVRFQVQAFNLTDHLNVINFAGLFSGTAVGAPRSVSAGIKASF